MSEHKELTDEEFDQRMLVMERIDTFLTDAHWVVEHSAYFTLAQRTWFTSFACDMFETWHDSVVEQWSKGPQP